MHKIILQDAIHTTSGKQLQGLSYKETKIEVKEGMTYTIYPDSLIPRRKMVFRESNHGPSQAQVAQNVRLLAMLAVVL